MSDTAQIILAVIGTGVTLLGILAGLLLALFRLLRQDIKETNTRIDALEGRLNARIDALDKRIDTLDARFTSRIDALYQALFSRKDPAA